MEAEPLYQQALALFEASLGPTHPKVVACLQNYAKWLRGMQRRDEARVVAARAKRAQAQHASRAEVPSAPSGVPQPNI